MRRLPRIDLPAWVTAALRAHQEKLRAAIATERTKDNPRINARIDAVWKARRSTKTLQAVELALRAMASGIERCMYCEDSHGCDIEHRHPKARYPASAFRWPNLLWICAPCNREKDDRFEREMLDPTRDDPLDHLVLSPSTGRYAAREGSRKGPATLRVLPRLHSDQTLTRGRQNALAKLRTFLRGYDAHMASGRRAEADAIRQVVVEEPFSAVFAAVLRASADPGAVEVLGDDLVAVLSRHAAMSRWLPDADDARVAAARPRIAALAGRAGSRKAKGPASKR